MTEQFKYASEKQHNLVRKLVACLCENTTGSIAEDIDALSITLGDCIALSEPIDLKSELETMAATIIASMNFSTAWKATQQTRH